MGFLDSSAGSLDVAEDRLPPSYPLLHGYAILLVGCCGRHTVGPLLTGSLAAVCCRYNSDAVESSSASSPQDRIQVSAIASMQVGVLFPQLCCAPPGAYTHAVGRGAQVAIVALTYNPQSSLDMIQRVSGLSRVDG